MYNDIASGLAAQNDLFLAGLGLAVGIFGFLLAQIFLPGFSRPIHKLGFAVWLSGFYLIAAMGYVFVWQGAQVAAQELGSELDPVRLGSLLFGGYGLALLLGFGFGLTARGRSISIFGRSSFAFLALIPALNAMFFVWKPNTIFAGEEPPKWYLKWTAIGAAALMAGVATLLLEPVLPSSEEIDDYAEYSAEDAEYDAQLVADRLARSTLSDTLWYVADDISGGYYLDDTVFLLDVDSTATALQFFYEVPELPETPLDEIAASFTDGGCSELWAKVLLDAGAQMQHVILLPDGTEVLNLTHGLGDCAVAVASVRPQARPEKLTATPRY